MCGIAGIFDTREFRAIDRELLSRMNETQFHRGPDEGGIHTEAGLGFGHRRLSIIDLSSGQQPLFNEDRSVVVTFNGEIYNFRELSEELRSLGHRFATHSDTEAIVHAWEEWGEDCVLRFRGMFAFAIWDRNSRTLFLARDRLGIKPLYYAVLPNQQFLFASELKALLAHPGLPREICHPAIEDYFTFGYVPDPKTILNHVLKLPPGCRLTIRHGKAIPNPDRYWDIPFAPAVEGSEEELQEELMKRFKEAVNVRLVSEVPLGAFLSGGVDSSGVVAMMAELSDAPVNTCSISFGNPEFNETRYAQMVVDRYRTNHAVESVEPDDFGLIDQLAGLYDEPFADSSAMPTYRVCELAKKRVTVALSGDGGDENLAGYRRHRWHINEESIRSRVPLAVRRPLFGALGRLYPKLDWAPKIFRAKTTFEALARSASDAYLHSVSIMSGAMRDALFSDRLKRDLQGYDSRQVFQEHCLRAPSDQPLSLIQYLDMKTYLPGDILTKVDRASMAHALEVRVPLLDHPLVEWMSGLSPEMKLRGQEGKYLFKKALQSRLPDEILYRDKMGFAVPLAEWFRGALKVRVREALLETGLAETGFFNPKTLQQLVRQHQSGQRDYSAPLWSLVMFESFLRRICGDHDRAKS
ncbi:MAG: amidotransferase 1, exosortase A system-associated [Methylococcaceae bacterium]|nr:amidotransferase 1, exosortase A system-associated [Methylococcaceae bacterium]